jgi:hypothetical protein
MSVHELRDADEAQRFLLQSLWLQRVLAPRGGQVAAALEWGLELAGGGEPLPPLGFVADVGHALFHDEAIVRHDVLQLAGWPEGLGRAYEDYVVGKLSADSSFERAGGALRHYNRRERVLGLSFLLKQMRERAGFGGVLLSPAVLKKLRERPGEELLALGWEAFEQHGPLPLLLELYEELVVAMRNSSELLGPEDVFELEHRTALAAFSQRLALRQVLQAAAALDAALPRQRPRPVPRRHDVATRILDEDTYPVGGFSSISTRGSIESLLHSQLAYMEPEAERPDLFDIKFLRDELLYYSRDENQFLRRRRTFVFALYPDLVQARFKDPELPWQRLVLLLGLSVAAVRKLLEWLTADALVFEFLFLDHDKEGSPLGAEQALLEMVWREQIANGTVIVTRLPQAQLAAQGARRARRSLCHVLTLSCVDRPLQADGTLVTRLALAGPCPGLGAQDEALQWPEAEEALAGWALVLEHLLRLWL